MSAATGNAITAPEHDCPLCGLHFAEGAVHCGGCPLNASCGTICCPRCGYEYVDRSATVDLFHRGLHVMRGWLRRMRSPYRMGG